MNRSNDCLRTRGGLCLGLLLGACSATSGGASGQPSHVPATGAEAAGSARAPGAAATRPQGQLYGQPAFVMPTGLTTLGAVALDDAVYVLGGYSGTPHDYSQRDPAALLDLGATGRAGTFVNIPVSAPASSVLPEARAPEGGRAHE